MEDINSSGNCTAIIIAALTYWQAKEISRVIREIDPEKADVDISLLAHVTDRGSWQVLEGRLFLRESVSLAS